jgi:hypothetical protein
MVSSFVAHTIDPPADAATDLTASWKATTASEASSRPHSSTSAFRLARPQQSRLAGRFSPPGDYEVPSRIVLKLAGASSSMKMLSDHAARSMV